MQQQFLSFGSSPGSLLEVCHEPADPYTSGTVESGRMLRRPSFATRLMSIWTVCCNLLGCWGQVLDAKVGMENGSAGRGPRSSTLNP